MKQQTYRAAMVLRLEDEQRARLRAAAAKAGVSMQTLVRAGIEAMIAQHTRRRSK